MNIQFSFPPVLLLWLISNTIIMQNWSRHLEQKLSDVMWRRQFNEARKWKASQCASRNLNRRCSRIYCHISWRSLLSLSLRRHKRKREPGRVFLWNFCRLQRTVFVYGNDLQTTRSIFWMSLTSNFQGWKRRSDIFRCCVIINDD